MADAIVVGSGPNGMAAALTLARAGLTVDVLEMGDTPGGGCRTADLTLPGFHHDICSAVHPMLTASPFFREAPLDLKMLTPEVMFAHPIDGGRAGAVVRSVETTAAGLGADAASYRKLFGPLVRNADKIVPALLAPLRSPSRHPLALAAFGLRGLLPSTVLVRRFDTDEARGLFAGVAAHAILPLTAPLTSVFGMMMAVLAHTEGWPVIAGGSERLIDAMVAELETLGGTVTTGTEVTSLADLPPAKAVLLDVTPRQLVAIGGDRLPARYVRALQRFRYGPGVFKVDWALSGPVPWAAPACRQAGTVHVGGTFEEVANAEGDVAAGRHPERPFCLVVQPGVVDPSRAPEGHSTLWAYCHVPPASSVDMTERIEEQIERFAPGFRDLIIGRATRSAPEMEAHNPNYVGGDITGGAGTLLQTVFRPTRQWNPYRTPVPRTYLCSASTPPGGGVHGMCGLWGARTALNDLKLT